MKIETLKKSHLKRNIMIGVVGVLIISVMILNFTRAKYRTTQSIPLVNGTINYTPADLNAVAIYVNGDNGYTKADTIPESGYVLNESESYCTINGEEDTNISLSYDTATKSLSLTPMTTKGTKCYLYFDEKGITTIQELIASKNLATRTDFSTTLTEDTTGTIYYEDTSKGRTYYFAGNPTDNWVKFADKYWRIIRINEDGSLRIIYSGDGSAQTTGSGTQIGESAFNSSSDNNMYVGYMYQSNQVHGLSSPSIIKGVLDTWYQNNLTSYTDKIDGNVGFCNDRTPTSGTGLGTNATDYAAYNRLVNNKQPSFECSNSSDLFTTSESTNGNKTLQYPIGLITADEVAFAGGVYKKTNTGYYLHTNEYYWTMSPYGLNGSYARVFYVDYDGWLDYLSVYGEYGVRPVINLKSNVQFSEGNGTAENPFIVS